MNPRLASTPDPTALVSPVRGSHMYWATPNCLFLLKCRHSVHDSPPKILEITKAGSRCVHLGLAEGAPKFPGTLGWSRKGIRACLYPSLTQSPNSSIA